MNAKEKNLKIITWGRSFKWKATPVKIEREIPCLGEGTENDPFIIKPSSLLPNYIEIKDSNPFIVIMDCERDYLVIKQSKNILVKNCVFNSNKLLGCSQIIFLDSMINKTLKSVNSKDISIENCSIKILKINSSSSVISKNCQIMKVKKSKNAKFSIIQT